MFGFILVPVNVISLLLTNGTKPTETILSPIEFLTVCETIVFLTFVLVSAVVVKVPILLFVPPAFHPNPLPLIPQAPAPCSCPRTCVSVPAQNCSHSPNIVPISTPSNSAFGISWVKVSNAPILSIVTSGRLSVSFHSSLGGSNSTVPAHTRTLNGFTLTVLVANGCSIWTTSVYGNVNKSPVFL